MAEYSPFSPSYHHYYESKAARDGTALASVSFAAALFAMLVLERICSAACVLLARLVFGADSLLLQNDCEPLRTVLVRLRKDGNEKFGSYIEAVLPSADDAIGNNNPLQGYASVQMLGAGMSFFSTVGSAIATATFEGLTALSSYLIWALATTLVFAALFIIQVKNPFKE